MDEQMMRERIRSLEEHTDKLVARSDALKAQLAERDAEIARLRQQVDAWQATGNAIMLCAVGREAPLSDSDVCGEINALRQQVAELQAWNDAVQSIAHHRMIPQNDNRSPINIEPGVKEQLHSYLMGQAPSGEGYSEFIARALAWREMLD